MEFLPIFDIFHFLTLLDRFKQKLIFCFEAPPPNPTLSIWGIKFIFVWNCQKESRLAQKGPKWSKTLRLAILVPFGPLWNVDKEVFYS